MNKYIRFLLAFVICGCLVLNATGCWNRRELDTLAILLGIGIDKSTDTGNVKLTAQVVKAGELKSSQKNGGSGGGGKSYLNMESTGDTVFEAIRGFTHESSRKMYFPHNQIMVLGRDIAEEGVRKYIDFFVRDPESRLNISVLVSKNTAAEILDVKPNFEKIPALDIYDLVEDQTATSETSIVKLKNFLERLMSKSTAPIAPLIEVLGEGDKKKIYVSGTAVFRKDKLVGELDKNETRGLLWVINKVKSGIIKVKCPDGKDEVSLEIVNAKSKITSEINGNKVIFKIKIQEEGNVGEQECTEDLSKPPKMNLLKKEKAEAIRGEVMSAFKKARELDADIFGFGEILHQRHPKQWKGMENRWDEIFQKVEVQVIVETKLKLTGQINKPVNPE
jgi:germination protein, Ger(x)C family